MPSSSYSTVPTLPMIMPGSKTMAFQALRKHPRALFTHVQQQAGRSCNGAFALARESGPCQPALDPGDRIFVQGPCPFHGIEKRVWQSIAQRGPCPHCGFNLCSLHSSELLAHQGCMPNLGRGHTACMCISLCSLYGAKAISHTKDVPQPWKLVDCTWKTSSGTTANRKPARTANVSRTVILLN